MATGIPDAWVNDCVLDVGLSAEAGAANAFVDAPTVSLSFEIASACASCAAGQSCCGGQCTLTQTDPGNCGVCGNACPMSNSSCANGSCGCSPPRATACGQDAGLGACVDLTSDANNCGKCGAACSGATPVCSGGSCVAACNTASNQTQCGSQCVTLGNDVNNCGACGNVCAASEICSGGLCTPLSSIGSVGCADGTREVLINQAIFPAIAACAGGWDGNGGKAGYTGVYPAPLRTPSPNCAQNGNDGSNPNGTGCSAIDLCAQGWHICAGGEVIARAQSSFDASSQPDGCKATTWPQGSFFAAAIGSTGYNECAEPYDTLTGPNCNNSSGQANCRANPAITNDIFGCGSIGVSVTTCGDVDESGGNLCGSVTANGWSCGSDGVRESVNAIRNPASAGGALGGVLCCASM